ncbi:hypothetical protein RchiOBHm_Chr6g0258181 [Rosa chinensis]|uniref:Uncharacterized protein n=2 Tax=Rosa chinensis TaxID=74649 RepID=A0A2P6PMK6_ROSCH|nr:hypothetical protein RchiOBHm_Chr6g0258181 [Rosa chinensis]
MPPPKDACQDNIQTTSLTIDAILERVDEDHSKDYSDHRFGSNLLFHPGLVTLEDV